MLLMPILISKICNDLGFWWLRSSEIRFFFYCYEHIDLFLIIKMFAGLDYGGLQVLTMVVMKRFILGKNT